MLPTIVQPLTAEEWNRRMEAGWFEQNETVHIWPVVEKIRVQMRRLDIQISNGRPSRALLADEMDTIRCSDIRAQVEKHQESVFLVVNGKQLHLRLSWHEQTTGVFGPISSREAHACRRLTMEELSEQHLAEAAGLVEPPPERNADRVGSAWRLGLVCPQCSRPRCQLLRSMPGENRWRCHKCHQAPTASSLRPNHSGNTQRGQDQRLYLKHAEAAATLAVRLLRAKVVRGGFQAPARLTYENPGLDNKRFTAICRLIDAHRAIADVAWMRVSLHEICSLVPDLAKEEREKWAREMALTVTCAQIDIQKYSWVKHQKNHLRCGRPSDAPPPSARAAAAVATLCTQGESSVAA